MFVICIDNTKVAVAGVVLYHTFFCCPPQGKLGFCRAGYYFVAKVCESFQVLLGCAYVCLVSSYNYWLAFFAQDFYEFEHIVFVGIGRDAFFI